jgi:predicted DNA-binding transcriptional regulator AlpA
MMKDKTQPKTLRMRQLTEYTSFSRAFIYQKISEGDFPAGTLISQGVRIWSRATVDAWIDQQMGRA